MYELPQGDIIFNGQSIKEITGNILLGRVGVALQEPFLWNDTFEANIGYGVDDVSFEAVKEAACVSGADEFIASLEDGYQTVIGDDACKLSQGQKQRIAIARAVCRKPALLILDEAMSSLDSLSEEIIIKNIKKHLPGVTLITVSHRLSAARLADKVYFMAGSSEIAAGSCDNLIAGDPRFKGLFARQL